MIHKQACPSDAELVRFSHRDPPARAFAVRIGESAFAAAPVATAERNAAESQSQETDPSPRFDADAKARILTVLIVEDDALVRTLFRRILLAQGFSVLEAEDGRTALRIAADHGAAIQLLVTDLHLPNLSGLEVARRTTRLHPECKVLLVSGYADDAMDAAETVETRYPLLLKPFTADAFVKQIDTILGRG